MNFFKKLGYFSGVAGLGLTIAFSLCAMDDAKSILIVNESALNSSDKAAINDLVPDWKDFYNKNDWKELIRFIKPQESGCGIIYELSKELPIFRKRSNETGCIVDMTKVGSATLPHYHLKTAEVYLILQGSGTVVIGGKEYKVNPGNVVFIPSKSAHFTAPDKNLVLAVVNIPFFSADDYISLPVSDAAVNEAVKYDHEQFMRFASASKQR